MQTNVYSLLAAPDDPDTIIDSTYIYRWCNPAYLSLVSKKDAAVTGRHILDVIGNERFRT